MISITLEELKVVITAETKDLTSKLEGVKSKLKGVENATTKTAASMNKSFKSVGSTIAKYLSFAAVTAGLIKLGKSAISAASDLEEVQNVVDVAFGNASAEIEKFAQSAITQFGITEYQAKKCASTFMAMSNGMGIAADAGKKMSVQLTGLAADMASFYNVTQDVAETALKSIFTGETESLKKFGVVMTEANLKAFALSQGIKKSYSEMSQAEKVALRYNYVLNATKNAQNDYARTSNSWANQIRLLKNNWTSFITELGKTLTQVLVPVVQWLNKLLTHLIAIAKAARAVFGKGNDTEAAANSFSSISDSTGTISDNLDEAQKTASKLRKTIAGFDELNIYQSKDDNASTTDDASSYGIDVGDLSSYFDITDTTAEAEALVEEYKQKLEELKQTFETFKPLIIGIVGAIAALKIIEMIAGVIEKVKAIKAAIELIKATFAGSTILTTLGGIGLIIAGLVTAVSSFVNMWKNGWNIIGEIIKDIGIALVAVGAVILGIVTGPVAAVAAAIVAVVSSLAIVIHEHWDEIKEWCTKTWTAIKDKTTEIWNSIKDFLSNTWNSIKDTCCNVWNSIKEWLSQLWSNIKSNAETAWTSIKNFFIETWENIKKIASEKWNAIKSTISSINENIRSNLSSAWNSIKSTVNNINENIKTTVSQKWEILKNNVTNISNNIKTVMTNVWGSIKSSIVSLNEAIGTSVSNIWNGISNTIKGVVNGIIGFINGMINGVVKGINNMIGALNKLAIDIPDWVPLVGGKKLGFSIKEISAPQIPMLAKGGVITSPTMAMVGEYSNARNNPEIVTPQNLLKEIINESNSELASVYTQVARQIIAAIESKELTVSIGDTAIGQAAQRANKQYYNMTGRALFTV